MIPRIQLSYEKVKMVVPVTLVFCGMISFNNLCLQYVHVSFYQVARSLTIVFSIALSYFVLSQSTPYDELIWAFVIAAGFALGSLGELQFSMLGLSFGVISSFFVALYGIVVKRGIEAFSGDKWQLLSCNTVLSIFLLVPFMLFSGEFSRFLQEPKVYELETWVVLTLVGVVGFLINIAMYLQISLTSPLTNTVSGTVKACVQTLIGWFFWRNPISTLVKKTAIRSF